MSDDTGAADGPEEAVGDPTPSGGVRAVVYRDETGAVVEIAELDSEGHPIFRTYADRTVSVSVSEDEIDDTLEAEGIEFPQPRRPGNEGAGI